MIRKLAFIICLTSLLSCGGKTIVLESWENGKPKITIHIKKGTKEKPEVYYMKTYYPNGNIFREGMVVDSLEDGEWKSYYITGEKKFKGRYILGKKDVDDTIYYRNGDMEQNGTDTADSITKASLYNEKGEMMEIDPTTTAIDPNRAPGSKWTNVEYANMHMECNMIFFDNFDNGSKLCSCFLDVAQQKVDYKKYQNMTDRQVSMLMKELYFHYQ